MNGGDKTNKMKLPSFLALILILFLSLSVVSASDNVLDVTNTSDSLIDNTLGISDSNNNDLGSNFDDSILENTLNESNPDNLDSYLSSSQSQENLNVNQEDLLSDNQDDESLDDEITVDGTKEQNGLGSSEI